MTPGYLRHLVLVSASAILFSNLHAAENAGKQQQLEQSFAAPTETRKPWCYWYWINDHITREGITKDLEAMARVGIGQAVIGNIYLVGIYGYNEPAGNVKVLTPEWWRMVDHALTEGKRVGVDISMFNSPGWGQAGGPWVKPEDSNRYLAFSELRVMGPQKFIGTVPAPGENFQDVALLAVPMADPASLAEAGAALTSTPAIPEPENMIDGSRETSATIPAGNSSLDITFPEAREIRSLVIQLAKHGWKGDVKVQSELPDGTWQDLGHVNANRWDPNPAVGFLPAGPVSLAIEPTTAKRFRIQFLGVEGAMEISNLLLTPGVWMEQFTEKQLGRIHPGPLTPWKENMWPQQADATGKAFTTGDVIDLSNKMSPDGSFTWDVPPGKWAILRAGMLPTGAKNGPASPEGTGLEVDKLNAGAVRRFFDAYMGKAVSMASASGHESLAYVHSDSWETGPPGWTDDFEKTFEARYGYSPRPWLPVLAGRAVNSRADSDRFLWDYRRHIADRTSSDYAGELRRAANEHGLRFSYENYGHFGFPGEFLQMGKNADTLLGEFWKEGELGTIELRAASSAANIYGKNQVSAEAFTAGGPAFQITPAALKARGDWAFCEGINHFVLHLFIHQPWNDRVPGMNAEFGFEYNRSNTWFENSRSWIDYLRRCGLMLEQGFRVADAAYFIGEDVPKNTGIRDPALPPGRDFDYINSEVLATATVRDGLITLPHGVAYPVLVLPPLDTMRPEVLRAIRNLVLAGATVLGNPPERSPSLENQPKADAEVRQLAGELWGNAAEPLRQVGKGRVARGMSMEQVYALLKLPPDLETTVPILHTHRRDDHKDIYFLTNQASADVSFDATFRIDGKAPEIWDPVHGTIIRPANYDFVDGRVRMPMHLGPTGSAFVVFREGNPAPAAGQRIVALHKDGQAVSTSKSSNNGMEIISAKYGIPGDDARTLDVRETLLKALKSGQRQIPIASFATPSDPAVGVVKTLRAELRVNGASVLLEGTDPETIELPRLPAAPWPAEALVSADGKSTLRIWQPGIYDISLDGGKVRQIDARNLASPLIINGPWQIAFEPARGGPETITFPELMDWTKHELPGIRNYSGKARYHTEFTLSAEVSKQPLMLDLDDVRDLATVTLNGKTFATLWCAPWRLDVTSAVRPGNNILEIQVVNTWNNRLVADHPLPQNERLTFLAAPTVRQTDLLPAGLLGPVKLRAAHVFSLAPSP